MDRRNFLRMMIGGVVAVAAERTFPFRVFSFPSQIVKPPFVLIEPYRHGFYVAKPDLSGWDFYNLAEVTDYHRKIYKHVATQTQYMFRSVLPPQVTE